MLKRALISGGAAAAAGLAAFAGIARTSGGPPVDEKTREALWESRGCVDDERGRWFRDAKFGAFIHFGPYSQLGGHFEGKAYRPAEQIIGLGDRRAVIPPAKYRDEVAGKFNPAKFDAAEWVSRIKAAGQKYIIFTTKHHDGFCMYKTATTPYNIVEQTPFGRDIVKELSEECRRQGIAFCPYYSIGDWCAAEVANPGYDGYRGYMLAQLDELLKNYGPVPMVWFDNWWYVDNQWVNDREHAMDLYAHVRTVSPGSLVNDRCGLGAKSTDGDYATPENQLQGSLQSRYFEVVMTNTADDHWGWVKGATNYRPPEQLIRNLIDSVSKGGNFVLNVGPTADGTFPAEHNANLEIIGAWVKTNGEAIYATTPAPEVTFEGAGSTAYATRSRDGRFTYVHVVDWPDRGGELTVNIAGPGGYMGQCLDADLGPVRVATAVTGEGTTVRLSPPAHLDRYATVIKLWIAPK